MGMAPAAHILFTRLLIYLIVHLPRPVLTDPALCQVLQCQSKEFQVVQQGSFRFVQRVSGLYVVSPDLRFDREFVQPRVRFTICSPYFNLNLTGSGQLCFAIHFAPPPGLQVDDG
jgi:hypothetical protein